MGWILKADFTKPLFSAIIQTGETVTELRSMRNMISSYVSRKAPRIAYIYNRIYKRILCWYVDLRDQLYIKRTGFAQLPPAHLRYRVYRCAHVRVFLEIGKKSSEDMESALGKIDKDLGSFRHILDFGCGCGGTLIWFAKRRQSCNFYGTDTDADAISWCRDNLKFGSFSVNNPLPPLEYPSEMFDLIYAISVFTHLNEDYQFHWLSELKRIAKPKGILISTVYGQHWLKDLPPEYLAKIKKEGFVFVRTDEWKGIFPEWYQLAFHTKEYVLERYAEYFDILDYIPGGMTNNQDIIILQKT
jgi:SAM-dependent methyltransferase